jgi:two-component system chemotaxis sensor kinase CheA
VNELNRDEFLAGFLAEADEHLRSATANLLAVEAALAKGEPHARAVRELFRSLHTIKGLSAMVDIEPIVQLAHEMETILRAADRGTARLTPASVELLMKGLRAIAQRLRAVGEKSPVAAAPPQLLAELGGIPVEPCEPAPRPAPRPQLPEELLAKLSVADQEHIVAGATNGQRVVRIDFVPCPALASRGFTITSVRERVAKHGDIVKVIPRAVPATAEAPGGLSFILLVLTTAPDETLATAAGTAPSALTSIPIAVAPADLGVAGPAAGDEEREESAPLKKSFVRVEVARLDDALDKLSALVVTRFRLARALAELRERGVQVRELNAILAENGRQLRDLRAAIMRARMVSVTDLLERVPLIVRGLSQRTGKLVRLEIDSGQAELDKAVAERVFPAIVHLVSNAVDHALEPPEERRELGKPEQGLVRVACLQHSYGQLELVVEDDGRGIDAGRVARKSGRPVPATDAELLELICLPGVTTSEGATTTSGRGMGMNIVQRTIDALGGYLTLATEAGKGSRFTLRVPLSIAILDAFTFVCSRQTFVVPVSMVEEIVEIDPEHVFSGPSLRPGRADTRLLRRRGKVVPLAELASVFGLPRPDGKTAGKALIVRKNGEPFAFAVDALLGQQEVVIRPLEDPLVNVDGVTGSTDLGDGKPTLVLDLVALTSRRAEEAIV